MKYTCKCQPGSPFLWRHDSRPSIFLKDSYFRGTAAAMSQSQTQVVERKRANGEDIGTLSGLSKKAQSIINLRQFTVYSRAGKVR